MMRSRTPYTFHEAYFDTLPHTRFGGGEPDPSARVNDLVWDVLDDARSLGWDVRYEYVKCGEAQLTGGRLGCLRPYGVGTYTSNPLRYRFDDFRGAILNVNPTVFDKAPRDVQRGIVAHEVSHVEKFLRDGTYRGEAENLFLDLCREIDAVHPNLSNDISCEFNRIWW